MRFGGRTGRGRGRDIVFRVIGGWEKNASAVIRINSIQVQSPATGARQLEPER